MFTENNFSEKKIDISKQLSFGKNLIIFVVVISLMAGSVGGALGVWFLAGTPKGQALLLGSSASNPVSKTILLEEESGVIEAVKKASPAVVSIVVSKDVGRYRSFEYNPFDFPFWGLPLEEPSGDTSPNIQQIGAGSGFFVSAEGLILTNKHVVQDEEASYTVITQDDKEYEAQVVARDPKNDLAIIKVDMENAPYLELADSSSLQIGQKVIAIGNSLGQYKNTVTTGIISGIGRSVGANDQAGFENLEGVIQTDAAINPGNSGGPLLNSAGMVIGINTAVDREGQLVGFAIPSNDAKRSLDSYNKNGKIIKPYLGVRYIIITPQIAKVENLQRDYGALVIHGNRMSEYAVIPGSPADKAGLVAGDIILEVDGVKLGHGETLTRLIGRKNAGEQIELKVFHRGQEKDMVVILEEMK